jgi:hypothetical protein
VEEEEVVAPVQEVRIPALGLLTQVLALIVALVQDQAPLAADQVPQAPQALPDLAPPVLPQEVRMPDHTPLDTQHQDQHLALLVIVGLLVHQEQVTVQPHRQDHTPVLENKTQRFKPIGRQTEFISTRPLLSLQCITTNILTAPAGPTNL